MPRYKELKPGEYRLRLTKYANITGHKNGKFVKAEVMPYKIWQRPEGFIKWLRFKLNMDKPEYKTIIITRLLSKPYWSVTVETWAEFYHKFQVVDKS